METEVLDFGSEGGAPVCMMKVGIMRWMGVPVYASEAQRARKFSQVLGTDSQKSSSLRSPRVVWSWMELLVPVVLALFCGDAYCDRHDFDGRVRACSVPEDQSFTQKDTAVDLDVVSLRCFYLRRLKNLTNHSSTILPSTISSFSRRNEC